MEIKREDILHLAELSNFSISEEEVKRLGEDLSGIVRYISQLDELDTDGIEPTYQVFPPEAHDQCMIANMISA